MRCRYATPPNTRCRSSSRQNTRTDWDILYDLSMRLGGVRTGLKVVDRALQLAHRLGLRPTPEHIVDLALRSGRYGNGFVPGRPGLSPCAARVVAARNRPGRAVAVSSDRIRTRDGKIDPGTQILVDDVTRVKTWLLQAPKQGTLLIGRRQLRTNNSWMHNCPSLVKARTDHT